MSPVVDELPAGDIPAAEPVTLTATPELLALASQAARLEAPAPADGELDQAAPGQQGQSPNPNAGMMEARMAVGGVVGLITRMVKKKTGVRVVIEDDDVEEGVRVWAPVLAKHGAEMPAWLKPYELELKAGMWTAGLLWGVYTQVEAELERRASEPKPEPAPSA